MGIVRDLYYARKMSAGLKLPAPTVALLVKRLRLAAAMGGDITKTVSGTMVHITDALAKAALSVLASIEPIQDLHGYANPWPAGGGKNKCSMADQTFVQFLEVEIDEIPAGTYKYSAVVTSSDTDTTQCAVIFLDADKNTLSSKRIDRSVGGSRVSIEFTVASPIKYVRLYASTGYPSGAGDTATFVDNMICLVSATDPTVYATYSNICPISGLTGLSVYRRSANLLNAATNITGKYIAANGSISNGDDAQYTDLIPVKAGETYACSLVSGRDNGTDRWHGYNANGGWVKQLAYVSASGQQGNKLVMVATIDSGISYVRLSYGRNDTEAMVSKGSQISADGYYLGAQVSGTITTSKNAPIQSPYTSASQFKGPAIVFSVLPGRMYAVKSNAVTNYIAIRFACYNNIEDINNISKAVSAGEGAAFVAPDGANYAVVAYINNASGVTFTFDEPCAGEMDTDYQPYGYDEYPCDWSAQAGTVYGGTLDVVTGQLTVDRAMVDMGERNYTKGNRNTDNTGYVFYFRDTSFKNLGELISSQFKTVYNIPNWEALPVNCCNSAGSSYIVFCADYPDAATFKTAMSGVQLCYELATPVTYQLTPQEVQMLLGENYVWSSSGDTVSVTYYAEGNANPLQSLNILLGGNYSNPKTADDVSDREALEIILGGNK